ncbi:MAG: DUF551 domain-containing protein [Lachnospiraceae bacterium]|nr:DUF551 domain-containing protein [Lachnospiraceae bacterium]
MNVLEKILEEISIIKTRYESGNHDFIFKKSALCTIVEVESIIRSHMDEVKNDGWIPVEERLPEDERMVLVTCQTKKGIRSTNRAYYDGAFWHGSGSMSSVTAWQPLPEPYKPK